MNRLIRLILMGILIFGSAYIVGLGYIKQHEGIHELIYEKYGIEGQVEIDYLRLNGKYTPQKSDNECTETCTALNIVNEVVGYTTALMILNLWIMFSVYLVYKIWIEEKQKWGIR